MGRNTPPKKRESNSTTFPSAQRKRYQVRQGLNRHSPPNLASWPPKSFTASLPAFERVPSADALVPSISWTRHTAAEHRRIDATRNSGYDEAIPQSGREPSAVQLACIACVSLRLTIRLQHDRHHPPCQVVATESKQVKNIVSFLLLDIVQRMFCVAQAGQ